MHVLHLVNVVGVRQDIIAERIIILLESLARCLKQYLHWFIAESPYAVVDAAVVFFSNPALAVYIWKSAKVIRIELSLNLKFLHCTVLRHEVKRDKETQQESTRKHKRNRNGPHFIAH